MFTDNTIKPLFFYQNTTSLETFPSITALDKLTYAQPLLRAWVGVLLLGYGQQSTSLAEYASEFRLLWSGLLINSTRSLFYNRNLNRPGRELREIYANRIIEARFRDGSVLDLSKTPGFFGPRLWHTSDFLMAEIRPFMNTIASLQSQMQRFRMDSIYGPGTLSVLEEIGYSTTRKLQTFRLVKDPEVMQIF